MITSPLQQAANRRNAMRSTGPNTPEGKAAIRLNALKYGLRAKTVILPSEDPAEYEQLWSDLESDWQPQSRTERLCLEQMATSQWLLARLTLWESCCCSDILIERRLSLLERISAQRARLERSFATAMRDLERLQTKRQVAATPARSGRAKAGSRANRTSLPAARLPDVGAAHLASAFLFPRYPLT
jgi:hypothetical protein